MSVRLARALGGLLVVVHLGLAIWAALGFAELLWSEVPWRRLSNPLFPRWLLALQWTLIGIAAVAFISGYLLRLRQTPRIMLCIYSAMALVCAYQTFFVLVHPGRFAAMALEYVEYALILLFLFRAPPMQQRFSSTTTTTPPNPTPR